MIPCYVCGSENQEHVLDISQKPDCEVDYGIPQHLYSRQIVRCTNCGAYNNIHNLIAKNFYSGHYNASISKDLQRRFDKIISLDFSQSDNKQRVKRVLDFIKPHFSPEGPKSMLDVGSGTCVFLHEVKQHSTVDAYCVDPDPAAIELAKKNVDLKGAYTGTLADISNAHKFDIITFNKVLEHVKNPIAILKEALMLLNDNGIIYIELPESDRIVAQNIIDQRAEFALEHWSIHNKESMKYIANKIEAKLLKLDVITDPSGKYTIYGFLQK